MNVEKVYEKGFNWLLTHGPNIVLGIIVLIFGLWLIRILNKLITIGMQQREFDPSLKIFLESLIVIALRVLLILAVMQLVGIQMTIFAALVGSFGVAAGLALSGTLQNFASGVLILLLKPFKVDDNIITQGQEGRVTSIQIFYTLITTADNKTIIVPNSKLSNEVIINITRMGNRGLDIEFKLNYGFSFEQIKETVKKTIDASEHILKVPNPRIGISSLENDGFKLKINVWLKAQNFEDRKMVFLEKLMIDLKKSGIKLPGM